MLIPIRCSTVAFYWLRVSVTAFAMVALLSRASAAELETSQPPGAGPLHIGEVVSWNDSGFEDSDGRRPDWIEIVNASGSPVDLAGFTLTDDLAVPDRWSFPPGSLGAGERVVVFASGRPEATSAAEFHAGFRVSSAGESLFLFGPGGTLSDAVAVAGVTLPDVSQGRLPSDPSEWRYFADPSPSAPNPSAGAVAIAPEVVFSHEAGFYPEPFDLELAAPAGGHVRVTLDGGEPSATSPVAAGPLRVVDRSSEPNGISTIDGTSIANQHTDGWFPPLGLVPKAFTVRARSFVPGALPGPVSTRTYFVGESPGERWGLAVVSLASPPDGLFDYDRGIYMLGAVFDEFRAANPGEALTGHTPANYTQRGRDWSRLGHFEFFEPGGRRVHRQNISLDIQGQSSRSFRQKSFGLQPRGDTSPRDFFDYPFFPGLQRRGPGGERSSFAGLRLRNSGNDWDLTMLRDRLCHTLAAPLGFDHMAARPVVVFLNGEFWGLYNLREQADTAMVADHYGVPEELVSIGEGDGFYKEGDPSGLGSYRALTDLVGRADLGNAAVFKAVEARMDVANFLLYQLAEIYIGNADWPHNNVRYWRGPEVGAPPPGAAPGFDGRWRWIFFDTDLAYGHPWSGGVGDPTLAAAISPTGRPGLAAPWSTLLLRGLLENEGFRDDFLNTAAGLLESVFEAEHAQQVLADLAASIEPVMPDQVARWRTSGSLTVMWERNVRVLRGFARQRPLALRQQFVREFGLDGTADVGVEVSPPRGGSVTVHRLRLDTGTPGIEGAVFPWEGTFFRGVPLHLEAEARPGYRFVGWDGQAAGDPGFTVALDGDATFRAVFEREAEPFPVAREGGFRFDAWSSASPAGSSPEHVRFEQCLAWAKTSDPLALPDAEWTGPYNLEDRSRFVGLGDDGIGLRETGRLAAFGGSGFPSAVVAELDTRGVAGVAVAWTAGTVDPGVRPTALRLQVAVGDGGFADVIGSGGTPLVYTAGATGDAVRFGPVFLPPEATGQPFVELRWRLDSPPGTGGTSALVRLDDIAVTASEPSPPAGIVAAEWSGPGRLTLTFAGGELGATYTVQWSADLATWVASGAPFVAGPDGGAVIDVEVDLPEPAPDTVFVRVARAM